METIAKLLGEHIHDDGESHRQTAKAIKRLSKSLDQIQRMPMQMIRWLGGAIAAATVAAMVQQYFQHQDVAAKAEQAAAAANQTSQQTARVSQQLDDLAGARK